MKKTYLSLLLLLTFPTAGLSAMVLQDSLSILVPRGHNPAFIEPGGTFEVEVSEIPGLNEKQWTAILKNDIKEWPLKVKSARRDSIHHRTEPGWVLVLESPKNISPELMTLELDHRSGPAGTSSRSVSIVPDFESDFYIFQQSDQHITVDKAVEPGGKSSTTWGNGSKEAMQWLDPILNLTNPRFVVYTGDNMQLYNNKDSWAGIEGSIKRVNTFMEGLSGYRVPTLVVTGNHDIGYDSYTENKAWREEYRKIMGQTAFSFRMGSFFVLASEWTNTKYLDWARSNLKTSLADPTIKYRLLAAHYYDGPEGWTTVATPGYPSDLLLVGHSHRTQTLQKDPYFVLATGTAQTYQRASFFDFKRTADGWQTAQPTVHAEKVNVHRLVGDYGAPTVSASYQVPNDGAASTNTVSIKNDLPHNFYNGRVRFLMNKGKYKVDGGRILSQYDSADGRYTAVLVQVEIKPGVSTVVNIK